MNFEEDKNQTMKIEEKKKVNENKITNFSTNEQNIIEQIYNMGFDKEKVINALKLTNFHKENAINLFFY